MSTSPLRILALGDSYTIGEGVAPEERWPDRLARALQSAGLAVSAPEYVARTGWTTGDLLSALCDNATLAPPYDLVTLLVGVNNQFAGDGLDAYRADLSDLAARAAALAGGRPERVLVVSIPDYGATPAGARLGAERIRDEVDAYNAVNCELAASLGALYGSITALSRLASDDPSLVANDGLHVSGRMYALWTEHLVRDGVIVQRLGEDR